MLFLIRILTRALETTLAMPVRIAAAFIVNVAYNPRLGWLRYVAFAGIAYVGFAVTLVYVIAPIRGMVGVHYDAAKLNYAAERWAGTAIYDKRGDFVGTYGLRDDSVRDVNYTSKPIAYANYEASPDHKIIPALDVPDDYWRCLKHHEDRYLGTWRNPSGIDLVGVLKIPFTTIARTLRTGRPSLGVGGSTLPMQFARVIYKTPPRRGESPWEKLGRKMREWWIAPVVYHHLTRGGDITPLKQWAANHLWLAQRTGGASLQGIEVASQIIFGKDARDLTTAEQFVLASAVNKPIILLKGSDKLNRVRIDRWRYILEVRATHCATALIRDPDRQAQVFHDLIQMGSGPPDPKVRPRLEAALETYHPRLAKRAEANPELRARTLVPSARLGAKAEMKQAFGNQWRNHVRTVRMSLDAAENLRFRDAIMRTLKGLNKQYGGQLKPGFTLDPVEGGGDRRMPDVVVVAADARGRIVRFYESSETAPYFGSAHAIDAKGFYRPAREGRAIASVGKMIPAIAIANEGRDGAKTKYVDTNAPSRGLETCRRRGNLRRGRTAEVAFACSLNGPLEWRAARIGQSRIRDLIDRLGFQMPPEDAAGTATPPSTAAVRGYIAGAPRTVHHMSAVLLASLTERGDLPIAPPTLVAEFKGRDDASDARLKQLRAGGIVPDTILKSRARPMLKRLLQSPLCYRAGGRSHGTLKTLANWCATRRADVRFHFAKTGTQVNEDPDETVDVWATGGLQFTNGAAYSYVVMIGTATPVEPFARSLHSGQVAGPLLATLLQDLKQHAAANPIVARAPAKPPQRRPTIAAARPKLPTASATSRRPKLAKQEQAFSAEAFFEQLEAR